MGGFTIKTLDLSALTGLQARLPSVAAKAEHAVANKIRADTQKYVPALNYVLQNTTDVKENMVIYPGPYAQFLYYGKLMVDPNTGSAWAKEGVKKVVTNKDLHIEPDSEHPKNNPDAKPKWFEVSKAQNLDKWLDVAKKEIARELNR